jgi:GTPase SAR1 family protein
MEEKKPGADQIQRTVAELQDLLQKKVKYLFERYDLDFNNLLMPLKWKPVVLIIGNYSSGKSTFINELLGSEVQRTGQAPTDDCFTILTAPDDVTGEVELPGHTVIRDERLPFSSLESFGDRMLSHLRLKLKSTPILEEVAIIDTPGMLDSVTEKDRGYDYLGVVGQLAKRADIIILMFDPLKAGTIKETYQAIRTTLPGSTSEDRILYVMNRIDECDNIGDLLRSYGTLCWNLSQMTGRKDIPRVFLTYSPMHAKVNENLLVWENERKELMDVIRKAPAKRLSYILQDIDKEIRGLRMEIEALKTFRNNFFGVFKNTMKKSVVAVLMVFLFGDLLLQQIFGHPSTAFLERLVQNEVDVQAMTIPLVFALVTMSLIMIYVRNFLFPGFVDKTIKNLDDLVALDTKYAQDIWERVQEQVKGQLMRNPAKHLKIPHQKYLRKINRFLEQEFQRYYQQYQK